MRVNHDRLVSMLAHHPRSSRAVIGGVAVLPLIIMLAGQARAEPNYAVFLQAIAGDGVVVDADEAIREGQDVCTLMAPPNGGSLWDAGKLVASRHPDWGIHLALKFADRSVQDICPNRGSF